MNNLNNLNIFKKKRSAKQVGESLVDAITALSENQGSEDAASTLGKRLGEAQVLVCGNANVQAKPEDGNTIVGILVESNKFLRLLEMLTLVPFEARKHAVTIFNVALGGNVAGFATHVQNNGAAFLKLLVFNYQDRHIALHCGSMLRQCLKIEKLASEFLNSKDMVLLDRFFKYYLKMDSSFDISSDAFATFRDALTLHKTMVASFLEANYETFFSRFNSLLVANSYVTQRQSLKLLSELLLERCNFNVMMLYIGEKDNLKLIMNLLRVKSKAIQVETFHVFKVFVANPQKTPEVENVLGRNRNKLISFLQSFDAGSEAEQINDEKSLLIEKLKEIAIPAPVAAVAPPAPTVSTDDQTDTEEHEEDEEANDNNNAKPATDKVEETAAGKTAQVQEKESGAKEQDAAGKTAQVQEKESGTKEQDAADKTAQVQEKESGTKEQDAAAQDALDGAAEQVAKVALEETSTETDDGQATTAAEPVPASPVVEAK